LYHYLLKVSSISALLLLSLPIFAATVIVASVLPVSDYTRITIESDQPIKHSMLILKNPDRVVLDLKNVPINQSLKALASKVLPNDFYIKKVRVANYKQGITRIVVDLKAEAKPKLSIYMPAGDYQHRLALDIYPAQETMMTQEENQEIATTGEAQADTSNSSESKSSGAKIILETKPALESDEDVELPADEQF
jgi:N-acetylmuramoyl-L-alanine amidase